MSDQSPSLVLFLPDDQTHVQELERQRIMCGWGIENVELWRSQVRDGDKGLYWIFASEPGKSSDLSELNASARAATVVRDEADRTAGNPAFRPLGHVSLDWTDYDGDETLASREERKVTLATFYIVASAQGRGLGRSTMDAVEALARSPAFGARAITLNTMPAQDMLSPTWCLKYGQPFLPEARIMQRWYERRGYKVYGTRNRPWWTDPTSGEKVGMPCVNMIINL